MPRLPEAPRPALAMLLCLLPTLLAAACNDGAGDARPAAATPTRAAAVAGVVGETSSTSLLALAEVTPASPVSTPVSGTPATSSIVEAAVPAAMNTPFPPAPTSTPEPPAATEVAAIAVPTNAAVPVPTDTPAPSSPTFTAIPSTATSIPALPTATRAPVTVAAASAPSSALAAEEISLINQYRAANGRSALRSDAALNNEAMQYAKLLGDTNTFGHNGADGSTPFTRFAAAGFAGGMCGEALAAGQDTAASALATWKESPSHNAILLGGGADSIGVAYYYAPNSTYKHYWVLVTGKSGANCPA